MASLTFSCLFNISSFTLTLFFLFGTTWGQLSPGFYNTICPNFNSIVRATVTSAIKTEPRMGASLLRLHFLDCFVNGCDASVLLDDTATFTGEKTATQNSNSARGFEVVDNIKARLEAACPGVVSCADILAAAAQASVVTLGGQAWNVLYGRRDSTTASLIDANSNIPSPSSSLSNLITSFSNKGFTAKDMVALSGAHTIGQARCTNFRDSIYNESNIDPSFKTTMQSSCPSSGGNDNLSPLDASQASFDNRYYNDLMSKKGLLHSDQELY